LPNIPAYIIGVLLLCLLAASVFHWKQKAEYNILDSKHKAFVAQTRAEGLEAQAKADKLKSAYLKIAAALEKEREDYHSHLDSTYAKYNRLRHDASTSSNRVRSLTEALKQIDCSSATRTGLTTGMERIESGVLARLAKSRDKAIVDLRTCVKEWTEMAEKSAQ
jgi:hypothetical protein